MVFIDSVQGSQAAVNQSSLAPLAHAVARVEMVERGMESMDAPVERLDEARIVGSRVARAAPGPVRPTLLVLFC